MKMKLLIAVLILLFVSTAAVGEQDKKESGGFLYSKSNSGFLYTDEPTEDYDNVYVDNATSAAVMVRNTDREEAGFDAGAKAAMNCVTVAVFFSEDHVESYKKCVEEAKNAYLDELRYE